MPQTQLDMVLSVKHVSKKFARNLKRSLYYGVRDIGAELLGRRRLDEHLREGEFWALKDVSLELIQGQAIGLVGANGSGKTTLLRLISGLIKLDSGEIRIKGQVAPLIALGSGFNPVLTGRENIFVNMAILGMTHREIAARLDDVVGFAEIGDAIDAPVQTYSSGMAARLGFSCAIHTKPDVLLIDEVLSVGDMRFRSKCYRRLADLKREGTSFILVSHNSNAIISMCDSVVYLNNGRVVSTGRPNEVMAQYEKELAINFGEDKGGKVYLPERSSELSCGMDITVIEFSDSSGESIINPESGKYAALQVRCVARKHFEDVGLGLIIRHAHGDLEPVLNLASNRDGANFRVSPGESVFSCVFPEVGMRPGFYSAKVYLAQVGLEVLDAVESFRFEVRSAEGMTDCAYFQSREWEFQLNGVSKPAGAIAHD